MNYGYDATTPGWHTHRMQRLGDALSAYLLTQPPDAHDRRAYVEVAEGDGHGGRTTLYPGVRVRRLTHYTETQLETMVAEFDAIFDRVMKGTEAPDDHQ